MGKPLVKYNHSFYFEGCCQMIKSSFTEDFNEVKPVSERVAGTATSWFYLHIYFPFLSRNWTFQFSCSAALLIQSQDVIWSISLSPFHSDFSFYFFWMVKIILLWDTTWLHKVIQTAQVMESSQNYPKERPKPTLCFLLEHKLIIFCLWPIANCLQRVGRSVNFILLLEVKLEISNFWASGACNAVGMAACTS